MGNESHIIKFQSLLEQIKGEVSTFKLEEIANCNDNFIEFCNESFLCLNSLYPKETERLLNSTNLLDRFNNDSLYLKKNIKKVKQYSFIYNLKTLQITLYNQKKPLHTKLLSVRDFIKFLNYDMTNIEQIISLGFIIQPETYETLVLSDYLKTVLSDG